MDLVNIIRQLKDIYPENLADDWDNSGPQIINFNKDIKNIVVTLDISDKLIDYAIEKDADLVISHHPMFFSNIKSIDISSYKGDLIKKIIDNEINIYSIHTNFDMASKGMSKLIANKLGFKNFEVLKPVKDKDELGYGGVSSLKKAFDLEEIIEWIKEKLEVKNLKCLSKGNKLYKKISFCGGSGGDFIKYAAKLSDIYITGDIKYHDYQLSYELGLDIIDIGHYNSEKFFIDYLSEFLKEKKSDLIINIFDTDVFNSIIK